MKSKILLVEDNVDNQKLMAWVLEEGDFEVSFADSGETALDMIRQSDYDLILMDIGLPGMSGEEVTKLLRAEKKYEKLPIVAVTAHAIPDEVERIMSAGFTELITKPIDEDKLLSSIASLLAGEQQDA